MPNFADSDAAHTRHDVVREGHQSLLKVRSSNVKKMTHEFTASRWTQDNRLFPATLTITDDLVTLARRDFFGLTERSIPRNQVSSVTVKITTYFAGVRIESSASKDIACYGFSKEDVLAIRELLKPKAGI